MFVPGLMSPTRLILKPLPLTESIWRGCCGYDVGLVSRSHHNRALSFNQTLFPAIRWKPSEHNRVMPAGAAARTRNLKAVICRRLPAASLMRMEGCTISSFIVRERLLELPGLRIGAFIKDLKTAKSR